MKPLKVLFLFLFPFSIAFGQVGHLMQGIGAANMSMGGAATAQPLDINGALHWNPAGIAAFENKEIKLDMGLFFSSPKLTSTVPEFDNQGQPTGNFFTGNTKDARGASIMPALGIVLGSESQHTFGLSAFGVSGFGVTFPENPTNPINAPQSLGGFGRIESNYMMMQMSVTYAYEITDELSAGIQHSFNYAQLSLMPNPTANPTPVGYPSTNATPSIGFGQNMGLFYNGKSGIKLGVAYKNTHHFQSFEFDNTFLDESTSGNSFNMNYPPIFSGGIGYSNELLDFAYDYRRVFYSKTSGFDQTGWTATGSVLGFGWQDISVMSTGVQYKGIDRVPLRMGYTYSSNPIPDEIAFFNVPATAIIKHAYQLGLSYVLNNRLTLDGVYHHATSAGATSGPLLNPMMIQNFPPYGAIPGSEVSYEMTTDMVMLGARWIL